MAANFEITEQYKNDFNQISILNKDSGEQITILPALGARLNEAKLKAKGKTYQVLKQLTSMEIKSRDELFNNAKLFPFAGRIKNGIYEFNGEQYSFPLNYPEEQNACHGFVYDKKFNMINYNLGGEEASITFELIDSSNVPGYPFAFSMIIVYSLKVSSEVKCISIVVNKSESILPFSDGWHHYFCLNDSINGLSIKTDVSDNIELNQYGIPTGSESATGESEFVKINNKSFDNLFRVNKKDKVITSLYSPADDITLSIWQQAGHKEYRYLIIYTPNDRQSIAIEPITSNINSFNTKQDLICLGPGMSWQSECGFSLR